MSNITTNHAITYTNISSPLIGLLWNSQNRKHHKYMWNVNVLLGKHQYGVKKLNRKQ